ncbi:MAG: divalent-cation tolerance protein CutA [Gemmatimonadales bacterium]|nr:MAG: divalent-cation tolerance protein CutA [Gemmatimonadales bacterium]
MSSSDGETLPPSGAPSSGSPPAGVRLVLVTAPVDEARALARTLVEEGLAACGNVLPGVHSVYRWEGAVEEAEEALVILKTSTEGEGRLLRRIPELHSYDVPEALVMEVPRGHPPYLEWVVRESGGRLGSGEG